MQNEKKFNVTQKATRTRCELLFVKIYDKGKNDERVWFEAVAKQLTFKLQAYYSSTAKFCKAFLREG